MRRKPRDASPAIRREDGFSLVESLIAIAVMGIGLLTMGAAFTMGMQQMSGSGLDFLAREKAAEAIESVFTARDTKTITWSMIRNVNGESGADGGVFADGDQSLTQSGSDGLVNTADDGDILESLPTPGPDGELGNDDDGIFELANFTREIEIRDLGPTLRRLRVIVRYAVGGETREFTITTYISSYA